MTTILITNHLIMTTLISEAHPPLKPWTPGILIAIASWLPICRGFHGLPSVMVCLPNMSMMSCATPCRYSVLTSCLFQCCQGAERRTWPGCWHAWPCRQQPRLRPSNARKSKRSYESVNKSSGLTITAAILNRWYRALQVLLLQHREWQVPVGRSGRYVGA